MGGGLESRCVGRVYGAAGAVARHHPHRTHDLRSGSQDHHPSKTSVQKTIRCNSTSNAPDDRRMYPKHVELRIHQYNHLIASSWHFTSSHEEDARSNNPHISSKFVKGTADFHACLYIVTGNLYEMHIAHTVI